MQGADDMQVTCEVDGIPVVIDRSVMSDFDTLEMFYDLQQLAESLEAGTADDDGMSNMVTVVPFARAIFGKAQWRRIKQTLREDDENSHIMNCINFIFSALNAAAEAAGGDLKN